MLTVLNAYFARAGAVIAHSGEVLKFIGDGVLAVFPTTVNGTRTKVAAEAALAAAHQAIAQLRRLNSETPQTLASIQGWKPLQAGIAIHEGEVFFGNVGSAGRIDFTVIGPAVNEAFRVEALQKSFGRDILVTEAAARHLDCKMDLLGKHGFSPIKLGGLSEGGLLVQARGSSWGQLIFKDMVKFD